MANVKQRSLLMMITLCTRTNSQRQKNHKDEQKFGSKCNFLRNEKTKIRKKNKLISALLQFTPVFFKSKVLRRLGGVYKTDLSGSGPIQNPP